MCSNYSAYCLFFIAISLAGGTELTDNVNQHDFLIISLDGKTVDQFKTIQQRFQELIAQLATDYCNGNGIQNGTVVNSSTVEIHNVVRCPNEWPDSELCISINVSVPVNFSGGYELSSRNLRRMWKTHSHSQLRALGVQEYAVPSSSTILIIWLCVTGLLFLLFLIILIFVIKTKFIENYLRRRRDILGSSNRSWLAQHGEKQLVPPLFYPEPPRTKLKEEQMQYDVNSSQIKASGIITALSVHDGQFQKLYSDNSNTGSEPNVRQRGFGIENPGYDPDIILNHKVEKQISQTTTIVDDFDSDDETIYPPSPLSRPALQRNERGKDIAVSAEELETAF